MMFVNLSRVSNNQVAYYAYPGARSHRYVTLTLSSRVMDGCVIFSAAEVSGYDKSLMASLIYKNFVTVCTIYSKGQQSAFAYQIDVLAK